MTHASLRSQADVPVPRHPGWRAGRRRTCEERTALLLAGSASEALRLAKQRGHDGQFDYANGDGNPVAFEFVGVMQLLGLDSQCGEDEVWYEIVERLLPMERADRFIPPEDLLEAIRNEANFTRTPGER